MIGLHLAETHSVICTVQIKLGMASRKLYQPPPNFN